LFLVTGGGGVWASYDRETAWAKFWLVVGAVLVYYALAGQPRENGWLVFGLFGAFAAIVAVYFILTHNFEAYPAKVELFNRIGLAFMQVRPSLPTHLLHPNVAGGLVAIFSPCLVALGLRAWRRRQWAILGLAAAGGVLVVMSLLLTTSRGAWLAFVAGMGIWALRGLSGTIAQASGKPRSLIFAVELAIAITLGLSFVLSYPGGARGLADSLPGPANAGSRLELVRHTSELAADVPFTGAGLESFPGLYSQYIMAIPFGLLIHAHNVYLDVALEQGVVGLLSLLVIMVGTILLVGRLGPAAGGRNTSLLRWAVITGVLVHAI
jgi:putative inorganic carbon (hco3(-)) transporter